MSAPRHACCEASLVPPRPQPGVGPPARGALVLDQIWRTRRAWFERTQLPRLRAHPHLGSERFAGACLIGSFTYDPFAWDDIDVVVVLDDDDVVFDVEHGARLDGDADDTTFDLITVSRGVLERPSALGEARFPPFFDSQGRTYAQLCLQKRCMAYALPYMMSFGEWIDPAPPWIARTIGRLEGRRAFCLRRLLREAECYLEDPGDALKGARRLFLATRILERSGAPVHPLESLRRALELGAQAPSSFPEALARAGISQAELRDLAQSLDLFVGARGGTDRDVQAS